jgi:hypothetical protein
MEDESRGILGGDAMTWSKETGTHKEPFVVLLHGVRVVSPDAFEIDVEWAFQEQWGMPAEKARGWYRVTWKPIPGFPDFRSMRAELPERLGLGEGALVRVSGIVQRDLEEGRAVSFPIDIAHGDLEQFLGE